MSALPDESTPEGIAARRKMFLSLESADLATLGPCPPQLRQTTVDIKLSDGFISRTILVYPTRTSAGGSTKCPLIIYIHGGSFSYFTPSFVLPAARGFAELFDAVVACPSYKLTPENAFPAPVHSAWESVSWLASEANLNSGPLNDSGVQVDPALGFVLAGTSAGGNIAAAIAGVAAAARLDRDDLVAGLPKIESKITGLFLSIPKLFHEQIMPEQYASLFRSREEHADAPVVNTMTLINSDLRLRPDVRSPWYSPVNLNLQEIRGEHPPKVYFQCGDLDILRDDAVVYERILRDGSVSETRIDVMEGYDHLAWVSLPLPLCHSQEMREKTLDGMSWLLGKDWDRKRVPPY
jgi:acetyl esterase/lipase